MLINIIMIDRKRSNYYAHRLSLRCYNIYIHKVKYYNKEWNIMEADRYLWYIKNNIKEIICYLKYN